MIALDHTMRLAALFAIDAFSVGLAAIFNF